MFTLSCYLGVVFCLLVVAAQGGWGFVVAVLYLALMFADAPAAFRQRRLNP